MDFNKIFDTYFERVYNKILGMVKNPEDAEDIAQEVFVSVYKNLKKFRKESNIYTWIYRIAINKTYDFFRKNKTTFELNEEILEIEDDTNVHTTMILEEKLKKINSREREIVLLKDIYGYKFREISKLKDMNLSTVKSIYYKGIKDMGGTG
jgi:RNA polymerase sigma-70 factor (ECF subfamily)